MTARTKAELIPETSLQRTYQYLRIGIGAAAVVIGLAVLFDWISTGELRPSISDYYDSPARNLFVGSLIAVSLGLFAISGRGVERVLLDVAAMFAPLIGLVPALQVNADAIASIDIGVKVYLVVGVLLIAFAIILRWRKGKAGIALEDPRGFIVSIVIGAVWLIALAVLYWFFLPCFLAIGHHVAAGSFFILMAIVAILQARQKPPMIEPFPDDPTGPVPPTPDQRRFYAIVGIALPLDVLVLLIVGGLDAAGIWEPPGALIFWLEAIAVALFAAFWFVQSYQKRNQANPRAAVIELDERKGG